MSKLFVSARKKVKTSLVLVGALALPFSMVACGGQTAFNGNVHVAGDAPPPPPKKEEPKPARVEVKDDKIEIHQKIQFDVAKATILEESFDLLDEITKVIQDNTQIKKISIEGHASSEGDAGFNKKLSDERAHAVMEYLVKHGVAESRLTAVGYGIERPLADNATEDGREKNRRVEFVIVEQEAKKTEASTTTESTTDTKASKAPAKPAKKK